MSEILLRITVLGSYLGVDKKLVGHVSFDKEEESTSSALLSLGG